MRRWTLPALLVALAAATPRALAASTPAPRELRAQVEQTLSGIEPTDVGPALRRLGPGAADALLQIAQGGGAALLRLRAIEALGEVPTAPGLAYLRGLVERRRGAADPLGVYELAAAARALGGWIDGEAVAAPLLDHESADVREGAAAALGRIGGERAVGALRARLGRERERGVRAALGRALAEAAARTPR